MDIQESYSIVYLCIHSLSIGLTAQICLISFSRRLENILEHYEIFQNLLELTITTQNMTEPSKTLRKSSILSTPSFRSKAEGARRQLPLNKPRVLPRQIHPRVPNPCRTGKLLLPRPARNHFQQTRFLQLLSLILRECRSELDL